MDDKRHVCPKCEGANIEMSYTWNDTYKCPICKYEIIDNDERAMRISYVVIALEHFKKICDKYGSFSKYLKDIEGYK